MGAALAHSIQAAQIAVQKQRRLSKREVRKTLEALAPEQSMAEQASWMKLLCWNRDAMHGIVL